MNVNHPHSQDVQGLECQLSCLLPKDSPSTAWTLPASLTSSYGGMHGRHAHSHFKGGETEVLHYETGQREAHEYILGDTVGRQLRKL